MQSMVSDPIYFAKVNKTIAQCMPPADWLPRGFNYPNCFFEYITLDDAEFDINGVSSTISFFYKHEVIEWDAYLRKTGCHVLIPFGRMDDDLFCFDKKNSNKIYLVDLSEKPIQEHELTQFKNFYEFINTIRASNGLQPEGQ